MLNGASAMDAVLLLVGKFAGECMGYFETSYSKTFRLKLLKIFFLFIFIN